MKLSSLIKGLITGGLMVALFLGTYKNMDLSNHRYVMVVYMAGIGWAIWSYAKAYNTARFRKLFQEGFKYFVVATLLIIIVSHIYNKMYVNAHPQLLEQYGKELTDYLTVTLKNKTPEEIESIVKENKEHRVLVITQSLIFIYLLVGVVASAVSAGLLYLSRKK